MCDVIERCLDVRMVSFISDELFSFSAMFALGRDVYINDDCAVVCSSVCYI